MDNVLGSSNFFIATKCNNVIIYE